MEKPPLIGAGADRISALPDEIIHNILYRLDAPGQATRTSALSRRWHHLWRSYPVVEFRGKQMYHTAAGRSKFADFAAASSRRLSHSGTRLDSLKLSLETTHTALSDEIATESFDWLLASELGANKGSPLEVVVRTNWGYSFPAGSLSNCNRTKVMKLEGCKLHELGSVSLRSLQVLHLENVGIADQSLRDFMGNAPNLESLSLKSCYGFGRLEVSASNFPKLKTLSLLKKAYGCQSPFELQLTTAPFLEGLVLCTWKGCTLRTESLLSAPNLKSVEITSFCNEDVARLDLDDFISKVPSLQVLKIFPMALGSTRRIEFQVTSAPCLKTLWFLGTKWISKLIIKSPVAAAPSLKVLKLNVPFGFTQSHLDELVSSLPCLESLSIHDCSSKASKIRVWGDRLRVFELLDWDEVEPLQELEIDAPNLVSASYSGDRFRFPGKVNIINASSDCRFVVLERGVPLTGMCFTHKWFLGLRQSLSTLTPFHLEMKLYGLNLSQQQQVPFDLGQLECSSPPLIIHRLQLEIANDNPPVATKQLQASSSSKLGDLQTCVSFLDGLLWACRPKIICITSQSANASGWFIEFICEKLCDKGIVNCCVGAKCWRHELRDVKINDTIHDNLKISKNDVLLLAKRAQVSLTLTWC